MKLIIFLAAVISISFLHLFALDPNWSGYADTSNVPACSSTVTVYSSVFQQMNWIEPVLIIKGNDTSVAGFHADSISLRYGYEQFSFCYNSIGVKDTCFRPQVFVDTFMVGDFGTMTEVTQDSMTVVHPHTNTGIDTIHCTGFAVKVRKISPLAGLYIRAWATGLAGNRKTHPIRLQFEFQGTQYTPVRSR